MSAAGVRGTAPERGVSRLVGAILRHPAVAPLKRHVQDAAWRWRARRVRNPPLPEGVIRQVLFLCQGNICRSPFAALRARQLLEARGLSEIACTSAGLKASQHPTSPSDAVAAAAPYGIALGGHGAKNCTLEELAAADVIVVMETRHVDRVRQRAPHLAGRVHLLGLYDPERLRFPGRERVDLLDPFGHDAAAFAHCYRRVDAALAQFVQAVAARTHGTA